MSTPGEQYTGPLWNNEESRIRTLWRLLAALGLLMLAFTLIGIVLRPLATVRPGGGRAAEFFDLLLLSLRYALLTVALAGIAKMVDRRYLTDLGVVVDRQWLGEWLRGVALGAAMVLVVVGVGLLSGLLRVERLGGASPRVLLAGLAVWTLYFLTLGTLEEVMVRGYVLVNLAEGLRGYAGSNRRAVIAAVGASAGLFGLLHAANPSASAMSVLNLVLFGCFLGWAAVATERLAVPIGVHVAWNVTLGPIAGLPVSGIPATPALVSTSETGPTVLTGGSFGPEGGLLGLVGLVVGIAGLWWWLDRQGMTRVSERIAEPDLWVDEDGAE